MRRKYSILVALLGLVSILGFTGAGIWMSTKSTPSFETGGYILGGEADQVKSISFLSGESYVSTLSGSISFEDSQGEKNTVAKESFAHLDDGSVMAMSDGILLDFNDLSDNFINNYYIRAGLPITEAGGTYTAETTAGTIQFGENLWKLSDRKYIVQSPKLTVSFSDTDVRQVEDYVQVMITEDNIVHLLTPENIWMTISENCCIETQGGVKVYPVRQMVDDGSYKLSLAKLAITQDEAITLTKDETRRQIVPELNIEGIDGDDGDDGQDGQSGRPGESGVNGQKGEDGQNGENGEKGADGQQGVDGQQGADGQKGSSGSSGSSGKKGASGSSGSSGSNGTSGADGSGGRNGGTGTAGKDAVVESSTNSALPTMSIGEWNVSGTALKGAINVANSDPLMAVSESGDMDKYPARITVTETATGKRIPCYVSTENYPPLTEDSLSTQGTSDNFYTEFNVQGTETVYFSTLEDVLEPDTEYSLSVTAFYKSTDDTGLVYSREFISRVFYTDSAGVFLSYDSATTGSISITVNKAPSYENSVALATVYLLTPEQNKTFSAASINNAANYVASADVDFNQNNNTRGTVTFSSGLQPDTKYVARVYVKTTAALSIMTRDVTEVRTLKRPPEYEASARVMANYNRLTGGYEVWRQHISDRDSGAVNYTYTAYSMPLDPTSGAAAGGGSGSLPSGGASYTGAVRADKPAESGVVPVPVALMSDTPGTGWTQAATRTVSADAGEPVVFHLPSGYLYIFSVEMEFDDNEKLVYYDLGDSDPVTGVGDSMPTTRVESGAQITYNSFDGNIRVQLGPKSRLKVSPGDELTIEVYAEQIMDKSIKAGASVKVPEEYYEVTIGTNGTYTNTFDLGLKLDNLYRNTQYTVTLIGQLDVGDNNGFKRRSIGTITFMTKNTKSLEAYWSTPTNYNTAFARDLKLDTNPPMSQETGHSPAAQESAYALEELRKGQVTVELYSGTGTGKLRLAQANINEEDDLNALYGSGLRVDESRFGSPALNPDGNYTLTVSQVADETYNLYAKDELNYMNTFEEIKNPSEVVSADPIPPDLLTDSSKGVIATPILNEFAVNYGGKVDENLPDDAVVGYTLEATYDNVQRIGRTITYYAYEYNTFFNALSQKNPLEIAEPLIKMTQKIDPGSDRVPGIALWFGGTKTKDEDAKNVNGYINYYAGSPQQEGESLISGMGRGYRYIFAYTVNYAGSSTSEESSKTYPYDHAEYEDYKNLHGGVRENNTQIGNRVAYILNSGMCSAPLMMPDIHSYVFNNSTEPLTSRDSPTAVGHVVLHYTWREREPEPIIKTDLTEELDTYVTLPSPTGNPDEPAEKHKINNNPLGGEDWYSVTATYRVTTAEPTLVVPTINISEYRLPYNGVLNAFGMEKDLVDYPLAKIPVEFPWGERFRMEYEGSGGGSQNNRAYVDMDMSKLDQNYIDFFIKYENAIDGGILTERAVAMELDIQLADDPTGTSKKTFLLPMVRDVNGDYARLVTGRLGPEYVNKNFKVSNVKIWHDTGLQGWEVAETDRSTGFTLQYINKRGSQENFTPSNYISTGNSSVIPANGSLLTTRDDFKVAQLREAVNLSGRHRGDPDLDKKLNFTYSNRVMKHGNSYYAYPDHLGVDFHNNSNLDQMSGQYVVPKKLAAYPLLFGVDETKTGNLSRVTPTIEHSSISASSRAFEVHGVKVTGFNKDGGEVMMGVYRTQEDAMDLGSTQYVGDIVRIRIGANGLPEDTVRFEGFSDSDANKKFYMAFFYAYKADDGSDVYVHLLDAETAEAAIYPVTTSANANIDITNLEYQNLSYFDKNLTIDFTTSRHFNLVMQYDIYDELKKAENPGEDNPPTLSYDQMKGTGSDGILTEPRILEFNNKAKIDLRPSLARKALVPGQTYFLRITAYETDAEGKPIKDAEAGHAIKPFEITSVGNYGALIYVELASNDSITYRVTINDPQFSFMGRNSQEGGLYAVRFTDKKGNRLYTSYDDQVFSTNEVRKTFVLDDKTLLNDSMSLLENQNIAGDSTYWMHIYAVPDADHDGVISVLDQDKTWKDFFDSAVKELKDCGKKFLNIINSFWQGDLKPDKSKDAEESHYLVASKEQKTTSEQNWLLNEDGVYATRFNTTTTRIIFEESFGLVGSDGSHVFQQITWSVEGKTGDGTPLSASGDLKVRDNQGDKMLKKGVDSGGYDNYYFDIPYEIGQGNYTIVLQFRTEYDSAAPARTITIRSGV